MQLTVLFLWIEGSFPVGFIATTPFVYPAISALHLIGIGPLFGSIVLVDLRLLRVLGPHFDPVMLPLVRNALLGLAIAAASGILLASIRIGDYGENPAFLAKMVLLLAAGMNALLLRVMSGSWNVAEMVGGSAGQIAATASFSLWIAAVFAGRWIAFA